ncbi:MAG: hydroxymethylglutaryl-CoA lyase [Cyclobacteriaceae bacterium]
MKIVECPRDAMQGLHDFIPTEVKASYINQLLKVGFDTIDFGSFVSPKAIPQMRDTAQVIEELQLENTVSRLLAIVANIRGAEDACQFEEISYLGFPLSLSETFQQRNTNRSIDEALHILNGIQDISLQNNKTLVTYISMGFGNPYSDPYNQETVITFVERLSNMGVAIISLADTIGVSQPETISYLFQNLIPAFPAIEFGAHLHSHPASARDKIDAAFKSGCQRFDGAIKGFGGCPMAKDDLVGNMATESIIDYLTNEKVIIDIDREAFAQAVVEATKVFPLS